MGYFLVPRSQGCSGASSESTHVFCLTLTQYTDGMFGPIVLHAPNETAMTGNQYDDDYTFMLNDMYNTQSDALTWRFEALGSGLDGNPGDEPSPDGGCVVSTISIVSLLTITLRMINGVSQAKCAYIPASNSVQPERRKRAGITPPATSLAQRQVFGDSTVYPVSNYCGNESMDNWNVTWEGVKTYRIRLINSGELSQVWEVDNMEADHSNGVLGTFVNTEFSIDSHPLTVIEADGTSVEPYTVSSVDIGVAQRYSVLVTLNQTAGAYYIRNTIATDQLRYTSLDFNDTTLGVLRYDGVDANLMPAASPPPALSGAASFDASTLVPADVIDAQAPTSQVFVQFGMQYTSNNQHYSECSSISNLGLLLTDS